MYFEILLFIQDGFLLAQRQERLQGGGDKRLESLQLPALQLASDYMDEHELQAKFKKTKRKVTYMYIQIKTSHSINDYRVRRKHAVKANTYFIHCKISQWCPLINYFCVGQDTQEAKTGTYRRGRLRHGQRTARYRRHRYATCTLCGTSCKV